MRKNFTLFVVLLVTCCATLAHAAIYPPGPTGTCPDSVTIERIQSGLQTPIACSPAIGDTVLGVRGIISGFDPYGGGYAIYFQDLTGNPWTGIDLFTGGTNRQPQWTGAECPAAGYCGGSNAPLAIGDEIVAYAAVGDFGGGTEIFGLSGAFGAPLVIRRVSTGNGEPPIHVGTVAELHQTNASSEQWEGMLVRVNGPLRVVRNSTTGGLVSSRSFLAVDNGVCPPGTPGSCDSLMVDQNTLDALRPDPPPVGTIVNMVQGIFEQRALGRHIETRGGDDIDVPLPPSITDAYHVHKDTIRVVFDRDLEPTSAEDENNYTILSTLGPPDHADLVLPNVVHLAYTNPLSNTELETIQAEIGLTAANGQASSEVTSESFLSGVLSLAAVQEPDPDSLMSVNGCVDRSILAGVGGETSQGGLGARLTIRGVCTAAYLGGNSVYMIEDAAGGLRSAATVFAPILGLVPGHQYLLSGAIQEFFGETEVTNIVYQRDEGPASIPTPIGISLTDVLDGTCDAMQLVVNPEDYESVLVDLTGTHSVEDRAAGQSFFVARVPYDGTFLVSPRNNSYTSFAAVTAHNVDVKGTISAFNGSWRINPRSDGDITDLGLATTGVGDHVNQVSFSVFPNPARQFQVAFGLPRASDVDLGVFDLVGRRVATIASGQMAAGEYRYQWAGELAGGSRAKPGLYFYRLTVDGQTHTQRGIFLQ